MRGDMLLCIALAALVTRAAGDHAEQPNSPASNGHVAYLLCVAFAGVLAFAGASVHQFKRRKRFIAHRNTTSSPEDCSFAQDTWSFGNQWKSFVSRNEPSTIDIKNADFDVTRKIFDSSDVVVAVTPKWPLLTLAQFTAVAVRKKHLLFTGPTDYVRATLSQRLGLLTCMALMSGALWVGVYRSLNVNKLEILFALVVGIIAYSVGVAVKLVFAIRTITPLRKHKMEFPLRKVEPVVEVGESDFRPVVDAPDNSVLQELARRKDGADEPIINLSPQEATAISDWEHKQCHLWRSVILQYVAAIQSDDKKALEKAKDYLRDIIYVVKNNCEQDSEVIARRYGRLVRVEGNPAPSVIIKEPAISLFLLAMVAVSWDCYAFAALLLKLGLVVSNPDYASITNAPAFLLGTATLVGDLACILTSIHSSPDDPQSSEIPEISMKVSRWVHNSVHVASKSAFHPWSCQDSVRRSFLLEAINGDEPYKPQKDQFSESNSEASSVAAEAVTLQPAASKWVDEEDGADNENEYLVTVYEDDFTKLLAFGANCELPNPNDARVKLMKSFLELRNTSFALRTICATLEKKTVDDCVQGLKLCIHYYELPVPAEHLWLKYVSAQFHGYFNESTLPFSSVFTFILAAMSSRIVDTKRLWAAMESFVIPRISVIMPGAYMSVRAKKKTKGFFAIAKRKTQSAIGSRLQLKSKEDNAVAKTIGLAVDHHLQSTEARFNPVLTRVLNQRILGLNFAYLVTNNVAPWTEDVVRRELQRRPYLFIRLGSNDRFCTGSPQFPFDSVTGAIPHARAGDSIVLCPGDYLPFAVVGVQSRVDRPVQIRGLRGARIVNPDPSRCGFGITLLACTNVIVGRLEVLNVHTAICIHNSCINTTLEDIRCADCVLTVRSPPPAFHNVYMSNVELVTPLSRWKRALQWRPPSTVMLVLGWLAVVGLGFISATFIWVFAGGLATTWVGWSMVSVAGICVLIDPAAGLVGTLYDVLRDSHDTVSLMFHVPSICAQ